MRRIISAELELIAAGIIDAVVMCNSVTRFTILGQRVEFSVLPF
jgi:hypothetical protein